MKNVCEEYKILSKNIRQQHIKLSVLGDNELSVAEVNVMPVNIFNAISLKRLKEIKQVIAKEVTYGFEGQLFKTIMKQIDITVKNANEIKDKDINFKYGLLVNNKYEYVDLGSYFIKDIEDDKKQESITVTGYDKMIRFMRPFKQSELKLTYPCKLSQLVQKMGEVCGVEIYSLEFYNTDLLIDDDFFTIQELTYRDVLEKITQATLTTAFIKDDKLYFCKIENTTVQKLDKSYISNLIVMEKFGPINALVIGRGSVEDNIEAKDDESILQNGRCEIRFDENELIQYSNRKDVVDGMLEQIKGLEYYSFEASDLGIMWLEPCDIIELGDRENNFYKSIYLCAHITLNTGIKCNISADIPEETNTKYKVTTKEEKKHLKVERLAKKNEGLIQDLIEENSEYEKKFTEVLQTVDTITQKVENEINITREVSGIKKITLENCIPGSVLELEIYGNNTVFDYLLPSDNLLPSDDLLPYGDSIILVNGEEIDLGIKEKLRQKNDVKDIYRNEKNKAKIIRKIGTFENNEEYVLPVEEVEDLDELTIPLKEGTNTIEIKNYTAQIKVRYVIKNDYTTTFASSVEVHSLIQQTVQEILMMISKKVGDEEVIAKLNLAIKDGQGIIELIGDIVKIKSKYFELTENGTITALKGIIAGLIMNTNDKGDSYLFKNYTIGNQTYQSGLFIPKEGSGTEAFLYAGVDITNGANSLSNANTIIQHNGLVKAKWFKVNGESGYLYIEYDNGNIAMSFTKDGINRYLENGNRWVSEGIGYLDNLPNSHTIWLYDALRFTIESGIHKEVLMSISRRGNNNEEPVTSFWTNLFVNGYQLGNSVSDKRLKKNIKECTKSGLEKIRQLKIKSFKWRKRKKQLTDSEEIVDFGIIAQDVIEVDPNSVIHNKEYDTFQMNDLDLICTCIKAIQEIDEKQKENKELKKQANIQQRKIDFLVEKLNCKEELEFFLKGDK